ncbi:MAG TPA: TM2 domain-containing protein [Bacteroidales bacterium]
MKKMILLSLVLAVTVLCSYNAKASSYVANDNQIDAMFTSAPEVVNTAFTNLSTTAISSAPLAAAAGKDAIVAIVLDLFLGEFGVHRFYLGTEVMTGIGYIITCGGIFGIVPIIDFVVLVIDNKDISKYINNPKFFMWN